MRALDCAGNDIRVQRNEKVRPTADVNCLLRMSREVVTVLAVAAVIEQAGRMLVCVRVQHILLKCAAERNAMQSPIMKG